VAERNVVCLHIGTHKTGTTALQTFLGINSRRLIDAGVFVPDVGRLPLHDDVRTAGHHALAAELLSGTSATVRTNVLTDIARMGAPLTVVSSENLHLLHAKPERLKLLVDELAALGYRTIVLVYLRAQPWYAESLYGEINRERRIMGVDAFFDGIRTNGYLENAPGQRFLFRYSTLIDGFAGVVGADNIIVRSYASGKPADWLFNDFLRVLAHVRGGLSLNGIALPFASPGDLPPPDDPSWEDAARVRASIERALAGRTGIDSGTRRDGV
jgi:hypothetical protein